MDKFAEEIAWVLGVALFLGFLLWGANIDSQEKERDRQDKRYEKCLDKGWQWVDNGCVKP